MVTVQAYEMAIRAVKKHKGVETKNNQFYAYRIEFITLGLLK